jgi:holo-[acyl-carrier protein] synthase
MSIYGVGVDLVDNKRIERLLYRYGERFPARILGPNEQVEYLGLRSKTGFLAKRFAAKEAFSKALGTGFQNGIRLTDIDVVHDDLGRPGFQLFGRTKAYAEACGIAGFHLSLADEREYSIAYVILVTN